MNTGTAARVADIYAQTLLDLAQQAETVGPVAADLDTLSTLLTQNPSFGAFLASPYFDEDTKKDLLRKVWANRVQRLTLNFLLVMIDHGRGALLPLIVNRFTQLYRRYQGYETVEVTVAKPLDGPQREKLLRDLAEALQMKVDLDVHVDPAILGGVVIRYNENMLDNSVRGRLARTINQLTNPQTRQKASL
jgi:F-type H+-transporting ATPase subunit delta